MASCRKKRCPPPVDPDDGFVIDRWRVVAEYGNTIRYGCDFGFKFNDSIRKGSCDDTGSWGKVATCAADPDCNFESQSSLTCGYNNPGNHWNRRYSRYPNRAAVTTGANAKLISPPISAKWTTSDFVCLKFKYKLANASYGLNVVSSEDYPNDKISWSTHPKERKLEQLDSLINIRLDQTIQYQFEVDGAGIELDDVLLNKHKCFDHCDSRPCQNGGSCTSRERSFNCFCPVDFKGDECEIDRKCRRPDWIRRNTHVVDITYYAHDMLLPESSVTYRCIENHRIVNALQFQTSQRSVCKEKEEKSVWEPPLENIACEANPDCDFESQSPFTCGYNNPGNLWRRRQYFRYRNNVALSTGANARLISPPIPADWAASNQHFVCLKFKYRLPDQRYGLKVASSEEHPNEGILWSTHPNEKRSIQLNSLINIRLDQTIQYQFKASGPGTELDDVLLVKRKCDDRCDSHPCQNGGSCTSRERSFTCFCPVDFKGNVCATDRKCRNPYGARPNTRDADIDYFDSEMLLPNSSVTYRCIKNYKISHAQQFQTLQTSVCEENRWGSEWKPPLENIECEEILCDDPIDQLSNMVLVRNDKWRVGVTATVKCIEGYGFELEDFVDTISCKANGEWSTSFTRCQDIRCTDAPYFRDRNLQRPITHDNEVTYRCISKYKFRGTGILTEKTSTCTRRYHRHQSYWEPDLDTYRCEKITCDTPKKSAHQLVGKSSQSQYRGSWYVDDRAIYWCEKGYRFDPNITTAIKSATCQERGQWSREATPCVEDIECKEPKRDIDNGKRVSLSKSPLNPRSLVMYRCDEGFKFSDEHVLLRTKVLTCTKRGGLGSEWRPSDDEVECVEIVCSDPVGGLLNMEVTEADKREWRIGETAIVKCTKGFDFKYQDFVDTISCMANGNWTTSFTECQDVRCQPPKHFLDRNLEEPEAHENEVTYTCKSKHKFPGNGVQTQKSSRCIRGYGGNASYWDPPLSTYWCKPITCDTPTTSSHQLVGNYSRHQNIGPWYVGDQAIFWCENGYRFDPEIPTPNESITCLDKEEWSHEATRCVENIECEEPTDIENAKRINLSPSPLNPNSTAVYSCNKGFKLSGESIHQGNKTLTCTKREQELGSEWRPSVDKVVCIAITCDAPSTSDHQLVGNYLRQHHRGPWHMEDRAIFWCENGYEFDPSVRSIVKNITCLGTEEWSDQPTPCVENIKCEEPQLRIENGKRISLTTSPLNPNSTAVYRCNKGFRLSGEGIHQRKKTLTCTKRGHKLGSEWHPSINEVKCIDIRCKSPEFNDSNIILNNTTQEKWLPGDHITFWCNSLYKFAGGSIESKTAKCTTLDDGQKSEWSPNIKELRCEEIICERPEAAPNQIIINIRDDKPWKPNDQANFMCEDGYSFSATDESPITNMICQNNGEWSKFPSDCLEKKECDIPKQKMTLESSQFNLLSNSRRRGAKAEYKCNNLHRLHVNGNASTSSKINLTCVEKPGPAAGSEWSPEIQTIECIRITCDTPKNQTGRKFWHYRDGEKLSRYDDPWYVDDEAIFKCKPYYKFDPKVEIVINRTRCLANGTWSNNGTLCVENTECEEPPPDIENGKQMSLFTPPLNPNSTVVYGCNEGFKLLGEDVNQRNKTLTCTGMKLGSEWRPAVNEVLCVKITCPSPKPAHHQNLINDRGNRTWTPGDQVIFECDEGFSFKASDENLVTNMTCQKDGQWSTHPSNCTEKLECDNPTVDTQQIEFKLLSNSASRGAVAQYKCKDLYRVQVNGNTKISSKINVTCVEKSEHPGSEWLPRIQTISCIHIACTSPEPALHQRIMNNPDEGTWKPGDRANFLCDEGYSINGMAENLETSITCQKDGQWSKSPISCVKNMECDKPMHRKVQLLSNSTSLGAVAAYKCKDIEHVRVDGIINSTSKINVTCKIKPGQERSEWYPSIQTISCVRKTCKFPNSTENHLIAVGKQKVSYNILTWVKVTCEEGYQFEINSSKKNRRIKCNKREKWIDIFKCVEAPQNNEENTNESNSGDEASQTTTVQTTFQNNRDDTDPDCDFEPRYRRKKPTCEYKNPGGNWIIQYFNPQDHRAVSKAEDAKLISPLISIYWASDFVCLKFKYRLTDSRFGLMVESTDEYPNENIHWSTHPNERRSIMLNSFINIRLDQTIQYQFKADGPGTELDDVRLLKEKCEDHCESSPCQNGGSCTSRDDGFTCFCSEDYTGNECETEIFCYRPTAGMDNIVLTEPDKRHWRVGERATAGCANGFGFKYRNSVNVISCTAERGNWNDSFTECQDISCPTPTFWSWNLWYRNLQLPVVRENELTFTCKLKYKFSGPGVQTQKTSNCIRRYGGNPSVWEPALSTFTCEYISCAVPKAQLIGYGWHYENTGQRLLNWGSGPWRADIEVTFWCKHGYRFDPNVQPFVNRATCLRTGQWSREVTSCVRNEPRQHYGG